MYYAYDTEFLEDGHTIEFISIGIVCEDGREYYAINSDCDFERVKQRDWLVRNVVPYLPVNEPGLLEEYLATDERSYQSPVSLHALKLDLTDSRVKPKFVIANEVRDFLLTVSEADARLYGPEPSLWAYYGAYDHVVITQLWGPMIDLPAGIPMFTHDIMQLLDETVPGATIRASSWLPLKPKNAHDALADARWNMEVLRKAKVVVPRAWGGSLIEARHT